MQSLRELWASLRGKGPAAAIALMLDLATARDNVRIALEAGGLIVDRLDGDLEVRVNGPNGDALNLRVVRRIAYPFHSLFLSNAAQAGKIAKLMILADAVDVDVTPRIAVKGAYLAPTALGAGGTAAIWTPATGKTVRLSRFSISVDAATRISLRWNTTAWESFYLPANGTVICNLVNCIESGGVGEALSLISSAAATVTARATGEEV